MISGIELNQRTIIMYNCPSSCTIIVCLKKHVSWKLNEIILFKKTKTNQSPGKGTELNWGGEGSRESIFLKDVLTACIGKPCFFPGFHCGEGFKTFAISGTAQSISICTLKNSSVLNTLNHRLDPVPVVSVFLATLHPSLNKHYYCYSRKQFAMSFLAP